MPFSRRLYRMFSPRVPVFPLLFTIAALLPARADKVHVFLVAGQSNASSYTAAGVREVLASGSAHRRTLVLLSSHAGSPMYRWNLEGNAGPNYADDLALVMTQMDLIRAHGDEPVFEALFWIQGESDCNNEQSISRYAARFDAMLGCYRSDLGLSEAFTFALGIIDANPDPYYDDPSKLGTTRGMVEALRAVQFQLGARANGSAADSRGRPRRDNWHLTDNAAVEFGREMARAYLEKFAPPRPLPSRMEIASADRSYRKADKDHDNSVSWEEFLSLTQPQKKERVLRKKHGTLAATLVQYSAWVFFEWFDANSSGTIDETEWLLGRTVEAQEATPDFQSIPEEIRDRNADGVCSSSEFKWLAAGIVPRERILEWYSAMER
jgi:hypothetical protein